MVKLQRYIYSFRVVFILLALSIFLNSCVREEIQAPQQKERSQEVDLEYEIEESFFVLVQALHHAQRMADNANKPIGVILEGKNNQGKISLYGINLNQAWKETPHITTKLFEYKLLPDITFTEKERYLWCEPQAGGIDFREKDKSMHANTNPPQADLYVTHKSLEHYQLGLVNLVKRKVQIQTYIYER